MSLELGEFKVQDYVRERYEFIGKLHCGRALVKGKNNLYGYIDADGVEVIPCQYDVGYDFSEGLGLVFKGNEKYFIDENGNVVITCPSKYEVVRPFYDGLAVVADRKNHYGYMNKELEEVIPCQFYGAWDFSEGYAVVDIRMALLKERMKRSRRYFSFPPARWTFMDKNGKFPKHLNGDFQIHFDSTFLGGYAKVSAYGFYSEATATQYMDDAFISVDGTFITDSKEVECINKIYQSHKAKQEGVNVKTQLLEYYSDITLLGHKTTVSAYTEAELLSRKIETLRQMQAKLDEFLTGGVKDFQSGVKEFQKVIS